MKQIIPITKLIVNALLLNMNAEQAVKLEKGLLRQKKQTLEQEQEIGHACLSLSRRAPAQVHDTKAVTGVTRVTRPFIYERNLPFPSCYSIYTGWYGT